MICYDLVAMHDLSILPHETIEEKIEYYKKYFENQGKSFEYEQLKKAIEHLSYKSAPVDLPKEESNKLPTLYVFRHGQTYDNADFTFSGWRDPHITKLGEKQALILADKIRNKKISRLYSSDQIRAVETMKLAVSKNRKAKKLSICIDARIKERSYGVYQGQSKLEIYMKNPAALEHIRRSFSSAPPEGESIEMVCKRVASFCDELVEIMKKEKINVAVSCHGNSIRGFRKYFENLSDERTAEVETPLGQDYIAYTIK